MKKTLSILTLAALTVALLGSCSKINERIDGLEKKVDGLENEQIASVQSQLDAIESSISDLGQIKSDVAALKTTFSGQGSDIDGLFEAEEALSERISDLEEYVAVFDDKYATPEWVKATFSTLEQYEATCDTIAKIEAAIGTLDARLSKEIGDCAESVKKWVNGQFGSYYTAAQVDASLEKMKADINAIIEVDAQTAEAIDSLTAEVAVVKDSIASVKAAIKAGCEAAVKKAIEESEGRLTSEIASALSAITSPVGEIKAKAESIGKDITELKTRVAALEGRIQSVTIVPVYDDGSVKVEDGTLSLTCGIEPVEAVKNLDCSNFSVIVNKVQTTKAVGLQTISVPEAGFNKDADKGTVELTVSITDYLPENDEDSTVTVAVNVKTGISDYTTEFVTVYPVAGPAPQKNPDYVIIGGLKWAKCNIGAAKETDYGYYFFWGGTEGYVYDSANSKWVKASDGSELSGGFTWANTPFNNGNADYNEAFFKSVKDTECPDGELASKNDAASVYCGANWRMPTADDFAALANACMEGGYTPGTVFSPNTSVNPSGAGVSVSKGIYWCTSYDGVAGLLFCDGTNRLFFPAAGYGYNNILRDACDLGYFWSSGLNTATIDCAHILSIYNSNVNPQGSYPRHDGLSVRPVSCVEK